MTNTSIKFKAGMTVLINSDMTGIGDKVTSHGYKKGDHVELKEYDRSDRTWRVKKADRDLIWIKRKNLAPLHVETPPFKIGDKVVLINKDSYWAKLDNVTKDKEYIVAACSSNSKNIKVTGNGAKGNLWIETESFKLSSLVVEPKTMRAVCIEPGTFAHFLKLGNTYDVQEAETIGDDKYFKVLNPDGGCYTINCWQSRFRVITETPTPTPVEPKKRMAVCIDMSASAADYQVGMTYEITRECADYFYLNNKPGGMPKWRFKEIIEPAVQTPTPFKVGDLVRLVRFDSAIYDKDCFMKLDNLTIGELYEVRSIGNNGQYPANTFIELKDKTYSHPIDCFELVATAQTSEYTIKVVCNNNSRYEGSLTIGKTYMAKLNPNNRDETKRHMYDIECNDKGTNLTTAYCHRFTVVTPDVTVIPPKVGDTLSAEWLNNSTPKQFHGYGDGKTWESRANLTFMSDRKILKIEERDGRMAALIAGTSNIWIAMAELTKAPEPVGKQHVIPDIAKEVPAPVMGEFLIELNALIQKYK